MCEKTIPKCDRKLAVTRAQQKRLDVLAGRRLLEPADHRRLPAVLGRVQDRQRLAARPVAQQQRRAEQVLPVLPAMHVHRPRDGGLDLGAVVDELVEFSVSVVDL